MFSGRSSRRHLPRISRLEALLAPNAILDEPIDVDTEEEGLIQFHRLDAQGLYQQEPDFPWLLDRFERALEKAKQSCDPLFDPPNSFAMHLDETGRQREWRNKSRFPELSQSFQAMLVMTERALTGEPPVSRAEWDALSAWYQSVRARLPGSNGAFLLPSGQWIGQAGLEMELKAYDGFIIGYTLTVLEELRQLHQHFGHIMN